MLTVEAVPGVATVKTEDVEVDAPPTTTELLTDETCLSTNAAVTKEDAHNSCAAPSMYFMLTRWLNNNEQIPKQAESKTQVAADRPPVYKDKASHTF